MSRFPLVVSPPVPLPKTSTRAVPPVESSKKRMTPPARSVGLPGPPLVVSVALLAVEVSLNCMKPPIAPLTAPPLVVKVPLPAVEVLKNCVVPSFLPLASLTAPPLVVKVPLPAVEVSRKSVSPPGASLTAVPLVMKVPLPAVEVAKNRVLPLLIKVVSLTAPPLLVKVPLPAVEVSRKLVLPPKALLTGLPLLVKVPSPAVEVLRNWIVPWLPAPSTAATKFCMIPELFVMPTPLMVNVNVGLTVIVNALAPELNTMPSTSVLADRWTAVLLEVAKKAVSDGPLGMVAGVQLAA